MGGCEALPAPPYFAQWESPELIGAFLRHEIPARDDPRWRMSGALSAEEYEWWSWRACGMACLRMVLARRGIDPPPTVVLAKEVLAAGGYRRRHDGGLDGLVYRPFVDYLARRWAMTATVEAPLSLDHVGAAIDDGAVVIASVSPAIRRPGSPVERRGGHLVLVHGRTPAGLVLHNPSGDDQATQRSASVATAHFEACFAGRGMIVP